MNAINEVRIKKQLEEIEDTFKLQQAHQYKVANTTAVERIKKLNRLKSVVLRYREEIKTALYNDFRKHPSEADLTEVYAITSEIKHTCRHLRKWMRDHQVGTPIALKGSSAYIRYEPKGVVLIISPWNFPISLTLNPLVSAIAAGNTIMLKPSEHTPHSSLILKKIVEEVFQKEEVALFEGGVETSTHLLARPFNHIFFTGSPTVGKIVMTAAAKHLTSVTLELGGKSPTIVDETANIDMAARRIAWGKYLNNGQICIAPDHIFVHESKQELFLSKVKEYVKKFYSEDPAKESSYARMVNSKHAQRVRSYVEDAVMQGAKVELGATYDDHQDYIAPTILTNIPDDAEIMKHEIFGPVMPIISFTKLDEAIKKINGREKPLALYVFSRNKKNINHIIANTRAGGTCINHNLVHFFNTNLPFGGSNNSGIGKGHGEFGFKAFSNARSILKQHMPNAIEILMPPYTDLKQKIIDLTIKFF